jgi:hypothetical protein
MTGAAGSLSSAKRSMLLLSTHPHIEITEPLVTWEGGNGDSKVVELLLSTYPDIPTSRSSNMLRVFFWALFPGMNDLIVHNILNNRRTYSASNQSLPGASQPEGTQ